MTVDSKVIQEQFIQAQEQLKKHLTENNLQRLVYPCCHQIRDVPTFSSNGEKITHVVCGGCMTKFEILPEYIQNNMLLPEEIPWSPHYIGSSAPTEKMEDG